MHITFEKKNIYPTLQNLVRIANNRNTLPILSHILVSAVDGEIVLSATDLSVGLRVPIVGDIQSEGAITCMGKLLTDILGSFSEDAPISLKQVATAQVEIKQGTHTYTVDMLPAEEFPQLPNVSKIDFEMHAKDFCEALKRVAFACSNEHTRPILESIYIQNGVDALDVVAADGWRIAHTQLPPVKMKQDAFSFYGKAVPNFLKTFGKSDRLGFHLNENLLGIKDIATDVLFTLRMEEDVFPKWEKFLQYKRDCEFRVERRAFYNALQNVQVLQTKKDATLVVHIDATDGDISVTTDIEGIGAATQKMPCEVICHEGSAVGIPQDVPNQTCEYHLGFAANLITPAIKQMQHKHIHISFNFDFLKKSQGILFSGGSGLDIHNVLIMPKSLNVD